MEDVENLVKSTAYEMEKLLATKTVVGEPIAVNGTTIIPLVAMGFGFGAGGGTGKSEKGPEGEGTGGGTGGGGGVKPVAVGCCQFLLLGPRAARTHVYIRSALVGNAAWVGVVDTNHCCVTGYRYRVIAEEVERGAVQSRELLLLGPCAA